MLRHALSLAIALLAAPAAADESRPVVVELFTSQGCSACPPADALLRELADEPDIIALGLHVDYWDYLGWRDIFAMPAATARQQAYADAFGERMVYTPQVVVNGREGIVGSRRSEILGAIEIARTQPMPAHLAIAAEAGGLLVRIAPADETVPSATVSYLTHQPPQSVAIGRGENGGATFIYANPVTGIMRLGPWSGEAAEWRLPMPSHEGRIVVLVQDTETLAVLGAAVHPLE